jgi:DNA-binding NarL/FixJ family response regulator
MIRVLLAEDQMIVRRGIVTLLGLTTDIRVEAEAADGVEALSIARSNRNLDVGLFDIRMPGLTGTGVLRELRRLGVSLPTILLTTFDEDPLFIEAVQAGDCGFLLKDVSVDRLAEAIRAVARGELLLQPVITERVMRIVQEMGNNFEVHADPEQLTPRERDVLRLIAAGYSNREIAGSLRMSEGSVKNHTSNVLSKLGARDRTRAVLRGIELGLI